MRSGAGGSAIAMSRFRASCFGGRGGEHNYSRKCFVLHYASVYLLHSSAIRYGCRLLSIWHGRPSSFLKLPNGTPEGTVDAEQLSRIQFGFTASFHVIFRPPSIG